MIVVEEVVVVVAVGFSVVDAVGFSVVDGIEDCSCCCKGNVVGEAIVPCIVPVLELELVVPLSLLLAAVT